MSNDDNTTSGAAAAATGDAAGPVTRSLQTLLAPDGGGGVFRTSDLVTLASVEQLVTDAGWRTAVADTAGIDDKRAVIGAIKRALGFDGEVGLNLDALVDVLRDVEGEPGTLLLWTGASDFAGADDEHYRQVLDVLRSRSRATADSQPGRFLTVLA